MPAHKLHGDWHQTHLEPNDCNWRRITKDPLQRMFERELIDFRLKIQLLKEVRGDGHTACATGLDPRERVLEVIARVLLSIDIVSEVTSNAVSGLMLILHDGCDAIPRLLAKSSE